MTHKEIIGKVIRLEKTPRLPVSLLSGGAWALNRSGLTMEQALAERPERLAEVIARTNEIVGCDIVWPGSGYHNLAIRGGRRADQVSYQRDARCYGVANSGCCSH